MQTPDNQSKGITGALTWKLLERFGVQGAQFVLQIVLARLLDPELYGILSLMVVFTTLANVFVQQGFNTALIQNKDVSEEDYSSVFWVTLGIAAVLYGVLYISAPGIAAFYDMPAIINPLRVLSLMLIPGALNSIQLAKVSREMDFRKVFFSNLGSIIVSGIVGIAMAYMGAGLWALVAQTMLNVTVSSIVMWFTVKWRPRMVCNLARIKVLFSYGWKLLVSNLLDTLYQDIQSLVIGKKYNADTLAYFNRGKQFPQFMINSVNGAIQSVMLPAMASQQDDKSKVKQMMRNSIKMSAFVVFPMMAGLAGVATPLVKLMLTDKWLPCVPYMQIFCFSYAFFPVHTSNLQAINAMGRSDLFLKLEIIKKIQGMIFLILAVVFFDSPMAIAMTGLITTVTSLFINAFPNVKLINYSYLEQFRDIFPSLLASMVMFTIVLMIGMLAISPLPMLLVQILAGVGVYVGIAAVFRLDPYIQALSLLKAFLPRKQG